MIENVTGIGPKMALSIMSRLSLPLLQAAIRSGDIATLAKCPGIGKKTAERLVVELKSRVGASGTVASVPSSGAPGAPRSHHADAVAALVALGYKIGEADEAVREGLTGARRFGHDRSDDQEGPGLTSGSVTAETGTPSSRQAEPGRVRPEHRSGQRLSGRALRSA